MLDHDEQQLCPFHTWLPPCPQADPAHFSPSSGSSRGQGGCGSRRVGEGQGILVNPLLCRSGEDKGQERWSDSPEALSKRATHTEVVSHQRAPRIPWAKATGPASAPSLSSSPLTREEEGRQNCEHVLSPSALCPGHIPVQGACKCLLPSRCHGGSHWQACLVPS